MTAQLHLFRGKRQRGRLPIPPLEFQVQCAVADVLRRWASPNWVWTHLPMGEYRPPRTALRLHRMGVQRGFPDFLLLAPKEAKTVGVHFLELKRLGEKPTEDQAAFALWCMLNDIPHAFADDFKTAIEILKKWGAVKDGINVQ